MKSFKQFLNKPTKSVPELADKHHEPKAQIKKELDKGTGVEKEHTTKTDVAKEIAKAHIDELPDYYEKLEKIEKK